MIEAGAAWIAEHGVSALTLRAVGAAAGVSRQAPYHHFRDKNAMLEAIAVAEFGRLTMGLKAVAEQAPDPESRLVRLGEAYVRLARAQPQIFDLLSGTEFVDRQAYPAVASARREAHEVLLRAVGEFLHATHAAYDAATVAGAAWALAHGLARLLNEGTLQPGQDALPGEAEFVHASLVAFTRGWGPG